MSQPGEEPAARFAAALSRHPEPAAAAGEVVGRLGELLGAPPSLAMLFVSGTHVDAVDDIVDAIDTLLTPHVLVGATAVGVVGGDTEIEETDGLAIWACTGVEAQPFRLESLPGNPPLVAGLPEGIEPGSTVVAVADPYTFPIEVLVEQVNQDHPGVALVGGLASATGQSDRNRVVLGDTVHLDGGAGFVLPPGVATPVVSQGCRPIGSPWVITDADSQLVRQLGGQPALTRLTQVVEGLTSAERASAARGLFVGVVADEQRARFDQGDFLIRGVLGADRTSGAIAVGDRVGVGQVLQFQIRDAASASSDLDRLMETVEGRSALLFTCNGRGSRLFSRPNHDAARVHQTVGNAVSGMFCAGELGPIAGRNAVHAFTATVLVFQ
jgi:small ligand-binding sensory domain FIST